MNSYSNIMREYSSYSDISESSDEDSDVLPHDELLSNFYDNGPYTCDELVKIMKYFNNLNQEMRSMEEEFKIFF